MGANGFEHGLVCEYFGPDRRLHGFVMRRYNATGRGTEGGPLGDRIALLATGDANLSTGASDGTDGHKTDRPVMSRRHDILSLRRTRMHAHKKSASRRSSESEKMCQKRTVSS